MVTKEDHSGERRSAEEQAHAELNPEEMHDTVEATKEIIEEILGMLGDSWEQIEQLNKRIAELEGQLAPAAGPPATPAPGEAPAARAAKQAAAPAGAQQSPPVNLEGVLIVDDSKLLQIRLKSIITQLGYGIVGIADNGRTGAKLALSRNPRLVILDYNMPEMNGLECLKAIRSQRSDIKVIVCSATITEEMSRELTKYGVNALLTKPIQLNRFIETVKTLMITPGAKHDAGNK
jgi:CheY-like chemotaxis protein